MSVCNNRSLKIETGEVGTWDFSPDLDSVQDTPFHKLERKQVNLKRGKNLGTTTLTGTDRIKDTGYPISRKAEKKRFTKDKENCGTARSRSASSLTIKEQRNNNMRHRSLSPVPTTLPFKADLPIRKLYNYTARIAEQFEIVKILLSHQPDPAGSLQELHRQRKRATEFGVRFSRNHLYQLKRLISDVKQIIIPSPFDNLAKSDGVILCKKILLACQAANQALQSYINYMKSGHSLNVPEKARELILLILDFYLCFEHLSLPNDQTDVLTACKDLVILLDAEISKSHFKTPILRQNERIKENEKEDKRFSMYKIKLTTSNWKKKTEALAKIKFGVPKLSYLKKIKQREENAAVPRKTMEIYSQKLENNPSADKGSKTGTDVGGSAKQAVKDKARVLPKRSHITPREVASQDDDIETVVQGIEDEDVTFTNRIFPNADFSPRNPSEDRPSHLTKNNVRELVLQTIQEIQTSKKGEVENSLRNLLKFLDSQDKTGDHTKNRNVKLIHIVSQEPIPEEPEEEACEDDQGHTSQLHSSIEGKEMTRKPLFQPSRKAEISLPKGKMQISQESSSAILKYRKLLIEYRRNNVMYKKGMPVRPCEMVVRISDRIINDILSEISSGMENENLLKQLYYNELLESA